MRMTRILIMSWLFIYGISSLNAQVNGNFSMDQLVEQEKNRYRSMTTNNALGIEQSMASANFDINHFRCEWMVDPAIRYIRGKITSAFTITSSTTNISFDLFDNLVVDSVLYHNVPVAFTRPGNNLLTINFPSTLNSGTRDSVSIYYQGAPTTTGFGSFTASSHSGTPDHLDPQRALWRP